MTDISIPGNSGLPVELSRWITGDDLRTGGFGDIGWQWDIPVIKANYMDEYWHAQASGTPLIEPGGWYSGQNCSGSYSPAPGVRVVGNPQAHNAPAYTYWSGKQLHIPGKTTEKFLENTPSATVKGQVTKSNFYVSSCLPLAGGEEGFIVKGPDGTTYTFDQIKTYRNGAMPPAITSPLSTFTKLIMVSKIEDRFGNTVEYHYNAHQDLDHILGSDGRRIDVAYTSYSYKNQIYYIAQTATANGKTWTYQYTDYVADTQSADKRKFLTDVVLPDNTSWHYGLGLKNLAFSPLSKHQYSNTSPTDNNIAGYCQPDDTTNQNGDSYPFGAVVINPDGLNIHYSFATRYFGRAKVNPQPYFTEARLKEFARNLNCSVTYALIAKTVSGRDLTVQNWNYQYSQNTGSYNDPVYQARQTGPFAPTFLAGIPDNMVDAEDYRSTTVTGPESKVVYYVDRRFLSATEGSVVAEDYFTSTGEPLLKRVEYSHQQDSTKIGDFWFVQGTSFDAPSSSSLNGNLIQHRINKTKVRTRLYYVGQGDDVYDTEYKDFDGFGFNEKTVESNTVNSAKRYTKQGYLHDETNWVLGLPTTTQISTTDSGYTMVGEIEYHNSTNGNLYPNWHLPYQYHAYGSVVRRFPEYHTNEDANGQLKRIENNVLLRKADGTPSTGKYRFQLLTNYKRGQAQTVTLSHRYSDSLTMAFSRTINNDGWVTSITDLNNTTVGYDYDNVGRLKSVDLPGSWLDTFIDWQQPANAAMSRTAYSCSLNAGKTGCVAGTIAMASTSTFDALYRQLISHDQDIANNINRYQRFEYNADNLTTFASYPDISAGNAKGVHTEYDSLQRQTATSQYGGGRATTEYLADNKIKTTGANNVAAHSTTTTYLAYGAPQYQQATFIDSPEGVDTSMAIDVFGNITAITQSGLHKGIPISQTEHRAYNAQKNLCQIKRNDVGTTIFSRNVLGEILWQAQGQSSASNTVCNTSASSTDKVSFSYDNLGGQRSQRYGTETRTTTMDKNGNITAITGAGYSQSYHYNALDLLEDETLNILADGKSFTLDYHYNSMGHLSDLTYPDASVGKVSFAPNAFGQATKATRVNAIYASNASYYPTGTVNTFTYGNKITHKTELNDRRQPSSIRDHLNQSDRLNMAYEYDHQSNITKISDNINAAYSLTNLAYDGLDRLTSTTGGSGIGSSSMTYDGLGNITQYTSKGASLDYTYDLSLNRLTSVNDTIGSKDYTFIDYDSRGNVTENGYVTNSRQRTFDYNLANQMTGSSGNLYLYDGANRRIRTKDSHGTSFSMYSQAGKLLYRETKDGGINYIFFGDKLIAKEGVMPISTNSRRHYKPFGDSIETPKDDVGYTGHKFDTDLGWSYMQQRYMDPVLGSFMSNDPVGFDNVHNFNRYVYANNNPYKYIDPDGRTSTAAGAAVGCAVSGPACPVGAVVGAVAGTVIGVIAVVAYNEMSDSGDGSSSSSDDNSESDDKSESKKDRRKRLKNERKERKQNEPASETKVKWKAKELEKKQGKDKKREAHDKKQKGEPDRSNARIEEDYSS